MRWQKLGLVARCDESRAWSRSHVMVPTPFLASDGTLRIYYTSLDEQGRGRPGYLELDPEDPIQVTYQTKEPLLDLGIPGCFDDSGVVVTSALEEPGGRVILYYVGFELLTTVRYRLLTGIAISDDGGRSFVRYSETPALERLPDELAFRGGPYVLSDSGHYRMWYAAGSGWTEIDGKSMPVYELRTLVSDDPLRWDGGGQACLELGSDEHGFGRPYVVRRRAGWEMYYSIRRRSLGAYRLGFARSDDGLEWTRSDNELNLDVSSDGWDSEAIMYAAVVDLPGGTYCFYNGRDFGREGVGVAKLVTA